LKKIEWKIDVFSFVIESGRKMTIGVISPNEKQKSGSVLSIISSYFGYSNGIQLAKFGLLIDRTSPIYLNVKLKALAFVMLLPFG
jgi:hypothetical protein